MTKLIVTYKRINGVITVTQLCVVCQDAKPVLNGNICTNCSDKIPQ